MDDSVSIFIKAAAVIKRADNKVLLVQRASNQRNGNMWEYPGGKVNVGEKIADCLKRELQEELSITPIRYKFITNVKMARYETYAYEVTEYDGQITLTEHQNLQWVARPKLIEHEQLPIDREISQIIVNRDVDSKILEIASHCVSMPHLDEEQKVWYIDCLPISMPYFYEDKKERYADYSRGNKKIRYYACSQTEAFQNRARLINEIMYALKMLLSFTNNNSR